MARKARSDVNRRKFLAAAAVAGVAVPSIMRAQTQDGTAPRSSSDRLEEALARIADRSGEGKRACLTVYADSAREEAAAADERARDGRPIGPLDGAIVSIKDLFDVKGEPTRAGSTVLADAPPAALDARVVERLRAGGAVIVAKTNMVEFAFSGIGVNPHYGTPGNPADRTRVPGGSSSGAGVAVGDGMCEIGIGSDTGGSVRIPAALCGIVGFKPSKQRIPTEGAFPLSYTLDSIGPLTKTVAQCAAADAVMADEAPVSLEPLQVNGVRFGIPQGLPLNDMDVVVAARFDDAKNRLARAGARLSDETFSLFDDMARMNAKGTFASIEAYAIHRERLKTKSGGYDPFVRTRIERGAGVAAADYIEMLRERATLVRAMDVRLADVDALVLPTTPIVAPGIAEVSNADTFFAKNLLLLRNTAIGNFFDLCAISLPLPRSGELPAGLMLMMRNGQDKSLLRIAAAVERLFAG